MLKIDVRDKKIIVTSNHNSIDENNIKKEVGLVINLMCLHYKLMLKEDKEKKNNYDILKDIVDVSVEDFEKEIQYY